MARARAGAGDRRSSTGCDRAAHWRYFDLTQCLDCVKRQLVFLGWIGFAAPAGVFRILPMINLASSIIALALLVAGLFVLFAYRRDLRASRLRLGGSRLAETSCGPIEYAEAGEGIPVLLVHRAGGGFDQGLELGRSLAARGFRILAMSRFGYLRTPLPANASAAAQADAHACLLDVLGVQRAAVMGFSAGGPSAMQFAIRHPQRCAALVLVVPLAYRPPELAASVPKPSPVADKVLMTIVSSDFVYWLGSKLARNVVIKRVVGTPPEVVKAASKEEREGVGRLLDNIQPISSRSRGILNDARIVTSLRRYELERIAAPTLIFSARDDGYATFAGAQYSAREISGARFVGFDIGGHLLVGHSDQVTEEIAQFLKSRAEQAQRKATDSATPGPDTA